MELLKYTLVLMFALALSSCGDDDDDNDDNDDNSGNEVEGTAADIIVAAHNEFRTAVGVDDIVWSEDLAKSAQEWADQLAVNCDFEHSSSGFGENIWLGSTGFFTPKDVVESWGSEIEFYNEANNTCDDVCGHYTQIVWSNSTEVGCGMVTCDGFDIWVCQYNPAGNVVGQRPY